MKDASLICQHLVTYADAALDGLTDEHLALAAPKGTKTGGWIVGHLCVVGDFMRRKSGRPPMTPKDWGPKFGPGTKPSHSRQDYPSMAELRKAFYDIHNDLAAVAPTLSQDVLDGVSPFEPTLHRFKNFREFMTWIMTGHMAYHIGQLHEWRSGAGIPARTPDR